MHGVIKDDRGETSVELGGKTYTYTSLLTLVEYAVPGLLQSKPEFGDNFENKTKGMKIRESDS